MATRTSKDYCSYTFHTNICNVHLHIYANFEHTKAMHGIVSVNLMSKNLWNASFTAQNFGALRGRLEELR